MAENQMSSTRPALTPAIGGVIAGVGLLCFIGALAYALRTPPENPEVAPLQKAIAESTDKLAAARAETPQLSTQSVSLRDQQAKLKSENDALENTIRERNVKLDKLQNERTALLAAAQKQQNEANDAAVKEQRELLLKNATQLNQTELQKALTSYQKMLVTILSEQGQLGTGFYYSLGTSAIIVSPLAQSSVNLQVILKVNVVVDSSGKTTTVAALGRVVYVDAETGLSFISPSFPASVQVHAFQENQLGKAASGDKVYTLSTQVLGDRVLDNNVLDGDVSSTERREGNFTYMQISMAANEGMSGGPVISRDGRLVGIIVGAAPGLERTSFALRAGELPQAMLRFRQAPVPPAPRDDPAERRADVQPRNPIANRNGVPEIDPGRAEAAARQHPVPYKKEEALSFGVGLDQSTLTAFDGPDGTLLVINKFHAKVAAYRPRTQTPVWEHPATGNVALTTLLGSNQMLELPAFGDKRNSPKTIDLRSGVATPKAGKFPSNMGRCVELANGIYFIPSNGSPSLFVDSSTGNFFNATTERVIGFTPERVFVMRSNNELGYFDMPAMLALQQQNQAFNQQLRTATTARDNTAIQQISAQQQQLNKRIEALPKMFSAELSSEASGLILQAASDRLLLGYELWEIKPTGVRKLGTLPKREHSAGAEAWFQGFYSIGFRFSKSPIHPIAVSPNGKWAISQTHLFDLTEFKIAAELPMPTEHGGILSDNKTIWLFDSINQAIYFLDIPTLTNGKP